MHILTISGSPRAESSNTELLQHLPQISSEHIFLHTDLPANLPLFTPPLDKAPWPESVLLLRQQVATADAVIFCTPEYIHNMPAVLKNCLEWLTSSGELMYKLVLAITYTPAPPRGEKAMQSLLWSLVALEARVASSLSLYQSELKVVNEKIEGDLDTIEMLTEALRLL